MPVARHRFAIPGTTAVINFVPPAAAKAQELHVRMAADAAPVVSELVPRRFTLAPTQLRQFEGTYATDEVDGTYAIVAAASGLVLRVPTRPDLELDPVFADTFSSRTLGVI